MSNNDDDFELGFTEKNLLLLEDAYAMGARKVEYEGKSTEFASGDEMLKRIRFMRRKLGLSKRVSNVQLTHDKNL